MCGITGFWDFSSQTSQERAANIAKHMGEAIRHRGPDSNGYWVDSQFSLAFSHQRLAIQDLSAAGHQPMESQSGRFVICYNGELYNTHDLKLELQKQNVEIKTNSDTEILIEGIEAFGINEMCKKCNGMFAFAVFDRRSHSLYLARDRLGKKPLYWGIQNNTLYFGSQPNSICAHPDFKASINTAAANAFFLYGVIPNPQSIYNDLATLEPSTILHFDQTGLRDKYSFWSIVDHLYETNAEVESQTHKNQNQLSSLLYKAVSNRLISDVPVGSFLSGGIDSSLVTALMQESTIGKANSFSIGFFEPKYNEADRSRNIAKHLGTDHHEFYVSEAEAQKIIPDLSNIYDEPFADSSQIPTAILCKYAKSTITVALSGDGGDELFCGYNRYLFGEFIHKIFKIFPYPVRRLMVCIFTSLPAESWDNMMHILRLSPPQAMIGDKIHKLAQIINKRDLKRIYPYLMKAEAFANYHQNSKGELPLDELDNVWNKSLLDAKNNITKAMQITDMQTYLTNDILVKVDRASMASAVEVRCPLLDIDLVDYAFKLPNKANRQGTKGKIPLRREARKFIPDQLLDGPKRGFGVPIDSWLKGSLKEWADSLIFEDISPVLDTKFDNMVRECWQQHTSGKRNHSQFIWNILMFQSWKQNYDLK